MQELLQPIKNESLKDIFVARFEELILSGKLSVGQKLPSERELALQLAVSRPVVHEGLVDLAAKGLVSMKPRVGTVVNDYRKEGSLPLLNSLVNYQQGRLDAELLNNLLAMRMLFEVETARLAASNRKTKHLQAFNALLKNQETVALDQAQNIAELDFDFHHLIAMATGNRIYPLLLNSFKQVYCNLAGQFFSDPTVVEAVFEFHRKMVQTIGQRDADGAARIMTEMLAHGEEHLKRLIERDSDGAGED